MGIALFIYVIFTADNLLSDTWNRVCVCGSLENKNLCIFILILNQHILLMVNFSLLGFYLGYELSLNVKKQILF